MSIIRLSNSSSSSLLSLITCSLLQASSLFTCQLTTLYLKSTLEKMITISLFRYRTMVGITISSKIKEAKALQ
jgi:hypothetical protein